MSPAHEQQRAKPSSGRAAGRNWVGFLRCSGELVFFLKLIDGDSTRVTRIGRGAIALEFGHAPGHPTCFESIFHLAGNWLGRGEIKAATKAKGGQQDGENGDTHGSF